MKIYRTILYIFTLILSCSSVAFNQVIYSTSFESPSDTAGWKGFFTLNDDVPAGGGTKSAYVSGGCAVPHAWIELGPFTSGGFYKIQCWGKNLGTGGLVSLEVQGLRDYRREVIISVNEQEWTFYESERLYSPPGTKIILAMIAGGLVPSAMLIDGIEVVKVQANTGWIVQNSGTTETLNDAAMLDSVTAVAVGNGSTVLKTTDSGETWRNIAPQIDCNKADCIFNWNAVAFFDRNNGLIAGESVLMISSDGGEEWQFLNTPSYGNFISIADAGLHNIFIGDDSGYVYNSIDTGKTWTSEKISDIPIVSIYPELYDPRILGLRIFTIYALTPNSLFVKRGTEPWKEWGPLGYFQGFGSAAFEGAFSQNGTQFIAGVQGDLISQSTIIRLRPEDLEWYFISPPNEIGELRSLTIPRTLEVYPASSMYPFPSFVYACGSQGKILKSSNNGNCWVSLLTPTSQNLNSVNFFTGEIGLAVGDSGIILYTATGGISLSNNPPLPFSLVSPENEDEMSIPRSLRFLWQKAGDPNGDAVEYTVLISEDSCNSWKAFGPVSDTAMQIQSPAMLPGKYFWKVIANDRMLEVSSEVFEFTVYSFADSKEKRRGMPAEFSLHQNYPNPFNPSTKIGYEIPVAGNVEIKIYDILGNEVLTLVKGFKTAGRYEAEWNAMNVSNGIYFCKFQAGSFSDTKKLILLK